MQKRIVLFSIYILSVSLSNVLCQTIFSDNGKFGIMDDGNKKITVSAEYDKITEAFKNESFGAEKSTHSFILNKNTKYYFALKKWAQTSINKESRDGWHSVPPSDGEETIEWEILSEEFDTLFRLEKSQPVIISKYFNIEDFETYMGDTCFEISKAIFPLVYRKNGQYGLLTFEKTSRTFGSYVIENLRIKRIHYSINNVIVHPASYEKISFLKRLDERENFYYGEDLIITSKNGKYGILNLHNNYEIEAQFDSIPSIQALVYEDEQRFYYAKKNGLWGVIYLNEKNPDFLITVPFQYQKKEDFDKSIRSIYYPVRHFYEVESIKKSEYDNYYVASIYSTLQGTPLQLKLIIRDREENKAIIRNPVTGNEELNKNYKPYSEEYINFVPIMSGQPIIQNDEFEYMCNSNIRYISLHGSKSDPLFFILKMNRSKDSANGNYNIFNRGKVEKNEMLRKKGGVNNSEYINRKPRGIAIYSFVNNHFIPYSEFGEEDNKASYEVISKSIKHITDYPETTETLYETNLILKSVKLENEKYKHTFFTFKGTKVHELTSKYQIDKWKFMEKDYDIVDYYVPDEDLAMEFFTEIKGEKNNKKKIVCYYNIKTRQFYR